MFSFFFSPTVLRVPSTDRPETLPPDRNLGGTPPKKIRGQKHAKFRSILDHFRHISGTAEDIQNRPALQTMAIPPAFNEESPVNFGPLTGWNYM